MRYLIESLKVGSTESSALLQNLVAEDPNIAHKRKDLLSKVDALEKVLSELRNIHM